VTGDAGRHPSADDLVLYHYGEADDREVLEAHVTGCAACRAELGRVRVALAAVPSDEPPERGANYGARVWERLQPRLDAPGAARPRRPFALRRVLLPVALAASLVLAFLLGRHYPRPGGEATSGPVRERILLVAVGDHLERSQVVLLELLNADPKATLDVSAEQRSAEDLLSANRLYRLAAARTGEPGVARVLEELERVLVEVANGPSELGPEETLALRRRIESQGVLFKVRVVGSQIRERQREAAQGPRKIEL
jgi:hypothetical protein